MMKVVVATHNQNKLKELQQILAPYNFELLSNVDIEVPEVVEDANSFIGNAVKKAREVAAFCQLPAIADDSGLEIDYLDGEPGIFSARYAESNEARIMKVLTKLDGQKNRRANFTCALAISLPTGWSRCVEGKVFGHISEEILGEGGFGYDPIFIPDGYKQSFAQLTGHQKNKLSHRYNACQEGIRQNIFEEMKGIISNNY